MTRKPLTPSQTLALWFACCTLRHRGCQGAMSRIVCSDPRPMWVTDPANRRVPPRPDSANLR